MKSSFVFFKWGFFLLVALNITLIILFFLPHDDHHHGPPRFDRIIEHLNTELKLSGNQKDKLVQLFDRHRNEMDSIHSQSNGKHDQMIECLKSGAAFCDTLNIQPSFDQILFQHHQRILKILTPTQRKQYLEDLETHRPPGPPPF